MELKCSIIPSLFIIVLCFQLSVVNAAGNDESCPGKVNGKINKACTYQHGILSITSHIRDCSNDPFMTICALVYEDDKQPVEWDFICNSPNYNLGCRYGYENCVKYDKTLDQQNFFLSWYDGITLGGKYSSCDMGRETLVDTLKTDSCYNSSIDQLQACAISFMQKFQDFTNMYTCSDMSTQISCFLDLLSPCSEKIAFNAFQTFFRGIVSLTECDGEITVVGSGAITTYASFWQILIGIISIFAANELFA